MGRNLTSWEYCLFISLKPSNRWHTTFLYMIVVQILPHRMKAFRQSQSVWIRLINARSVYHTSIYPRFSFGTRPVLAFHKRTLKGSKFSETVRCTHTIQVHIPIICCLSIKLPLFTELNCIEFNLHEFVYHSCSTT